MNCHGGHGPRKGSGTTDAPACLFVNSWDCRCSRQYSVLKNGYMYILGWMMHCKTGKAWALGMLAAQQHWISEVNGGGWGTSKEEDPGTSTPSHRLLIDWLYLGMPQDGTDTGRPDGHDGGLCHLRDPKRKRGPPGGDGSLMPSATERFAPAVRAALGPLLGRRQVSDRPFYGAALAQAGVLAQPLLGHLCRFAMFHLVIGGDFDGHKLQNMEIKRRKHRLCLSLARNAHSGSKVEWGLREPPLGNGWILP
ncbi:hypothetical protein B0T17DRAFT_594208 [Bombardia bombarda]|uniref:Uncharacterized protein n=1 Tax=Bombardia bombarda TaxID=252184 RepID=A0AA39XJR0_9PEZI|nr:hypothetical protein B0T17DRAFT_594208 [Bombardia bombarda]